MNTSWSCNGHRFHIDMNDLETLERYDAAVLAMRGEFQKLPAGATDARQLIAYCAGVRAMIDTLCGEGTTELLISDSKRPTDYDDVYESLTDFVHDQVADAAERRQKLLRKYKPDPNREARRVLDQLAEKIEKPT